MLSQTVLVGLFVSLATGEWVGNDCSNTWFGHKLCNYCRPDDFDPEHPKPDRRQCLCYPCRGAFPAGHIGFGPLSIGGNGQDCNYVCQCHACQPDTSIFLTVKHNDKDIAIPFYAVAGVLGFASFVTIAVVTAFIAKRMAIPSLAQPLLAEDPDSADSATVAVI